MSPEKKEYSLFKRNSFALLLLGVAWFALLGLTGTLWSGFHFTDDHEVFTVGRDANHSSFSRELSILKREIVAPQMRFRPLYHMTRRCAIYLLGENFTAWSIYYGLIAVLTSFLLFLFMKQMGYSPLEAFFFPGLSLLGAQAAIWWKLGSNETIGMFMLALTLFFMARAVYATRGKTLYTILFLLFALLTSWSKESFILVLPALVVWQMGLTYWREKEKKTQENWVHLITAIKENGLAGLFLMLWCGIQLIHIVKNVGTSGVKYAGYDGFRLALFFKTAGQAFDSVWGWVILVELAILLFLMYRQKPKRWQQIGLPLLVAGLFFLPQVVLHMKSGMVERYLLPGVLGLAYAMVALWHCISLETPSGTTPNRTTGWRFSFSPTYLVVLVMLLTVLLVQLRVTRYTAMAFAREGRDTNGWFASIHQHTQPQDTLLVITHINRYYEPSFGLKIYLTAKRQQEHILFSPPSLDIAPRARGFWQAMNATFWSRFPAFSLPRAPGEVPFQAILIFPGLEEPFLRAAAPWFNPLHYERYSNDSHYVSYYPLKD